MIDDPDVVSECPRCGANILRVHRVESKGGPEVYRCPSCGFEQWVEVLQPPRRLDEGESPNRTLYVVWGAGTPSSTELRALRELLPQYREVPLSELRASLTSPELRVGDFATWEADELAKRAGELGLTVKLR